MGSQLHKYPKIYQGYQYLNILHQGIYVLRELLYGTNYTKLQNTLIKYELSYSTKLTKTKTLIILHSFSKGK